jgi:parallel beta-helix repeat protein
MERTVDMTHTFKLARRIARLKLPGAHLRASAPTSLGPVLHRSPWRFMITVVVALTSGCTDNDISEITSASGTEITPAERRQAPGRGGKKLVSLVVAPDTARLAPAQVTQFSAKARRNDGVLVAVPVQWSAAGGTIDSTGKFTAGRTVGDYRIVAKQSSGTLADTARVTIRSDAPTTQAVVLTPQTVSLQPGAKTAFQATVKMSDGSTGTGRVTYSGSGGAIDSAGNYTAGEAPGSFRVIATSEAAGLADTSTVTITAAPTTCTGSATVICPGDNWQAKVNAAPSGTVFSIGAGVHRGQRVVAKANQQFIGEPGAIMSGAKLLTGWVQSGAAWYVTGQTQEFAHTIGQCASGTACQYPEDVYRDDVLLKRELSLGALGPGEFYFDYAADRIYVGDDPNGRKLEAAATDYAFLGSPDGAGTGVTLRNLVIEKYANQAQYGAIGRSNTPAGWTIDACELRYNHGAAVRTGAIRVINSHIHHNAQIGIVGGGSSATLIQNNEIAYNNTGGFWPHWEAGGIKLAGGTFSGIQVRNNRIHHNKGIGLWLDGFGDQLVFDGNRIEDNEWDGIQWELSQGGQITNNIILRNGFSNPNRSEGAGIMVANSGGTGLVVSGNTLSGNKNGIILQEASRGSGPFGPLITQNVHVHHNTVTLANNQTHGAVQYSGDGSLWSRRNNRFESNTYNLQAAPAAPFIWSNNTLMTDAQWRASGEDATGTFNR